MRNAYARNRINAPENAQINQNTPDERAALNARNRLTISVRLAFRKLDTYSNFTGLSGTRLSLRANERRRAREKRKKRRKKQSERERERESCESNFRVALPRLLSGSYARRTTSSRFLLVRFHGTAIAVKMPPTSPAREFRNSEISLSRSQKEKRERRGRAEERRANGLSSASRRIN